MHDGWVSELLNANKAKEPTISPFARMCIETGMRMGYILTGEGKTAKEEKFAALFGSLDPSVQDGVLAMMEKMQR